MIFTTNNRIYLILSGSSWYNRRKIDRGIHMNEHCNILILSVTAGNGHNSAAAALKEEFDRQGVNCHIMDLFQYLSPLAAKLISDGYDQ